VINVKERIRPVHWAGKIRLHGECGALKHEEHLESHSEKGMGLPKRRHNLKNGMKAEGRSGGHERCAWIQYILLFIISGSYEELRTVLSSPVRR
jgi:hypothetical protein